MRPRPLPHTTGMTLSRTTIVRNSGGSAESSAHWQQAHGQAAGSRSTGDYSLSRSDAAPGSQAASYHRLLTHIIDRRPFLFTTLCRCYVSNLAGRYHGPVICSVADLLVLLGHRGARGADLAKKYVTVLRAAENSRPPPMRRSGRTPHTTLARASSSWLCLLMLTTCPIVDTLLLTLHHSLSAAHRAGCTIIRVVQGCARLFFFFSMPPLVRLCLCS